MLSVQNLSKKIKGIVALDYMDIPLREGEIRGIIGPNNAGKWLSLIGIFGMQRDGQGRIVIRGRDVSRMATKKTVAPGIALCPRGLRPCGGRVGF